MRPGHASTGAGGRRRRNGAHQLSRVHSESLMSRPENAALADCPQIGMLSKSLNFAFVARYSAKSSATIDLDEAVVNARPGAKLPTIAIAATIAAFAAVSAACSAGASDAVSFAGQAGARRSCRQQRVAVAAGCAKWRAYRQNACATESRGAGEILGAAARPVRG